MVERLNKIRQLLKRKKIDAVIITNPYNRRYLSGFDGSAGVLLISLEKALLITDFRYVEQAAAQAKQFTIHRWQDNLIGSLAMLIDNEDWSKIGFESKHVVYSIYDEMKEKLPVELVSLSDTAEKQRMIKNEDELAALRFGTKILDQAFKHICSFIRPGITEREVALELEIYLLRQGAEEKSFHFIVASGKRGAMPHGTASTKELTRGELITIDFGAVFGGYATDMTRTVALGAVSQRQIEIYDIVKEAQQKASLAIKPGLKGREVDAVARDTIVKAGYGEYFGHGLGHGIGLETHEQPVLNPQSNTVLKAGMVVTVEPGIYIPEWGGVRIEDMVVVTKSSVNLLTSSPRELIII
jgi:Xaa-Pro aminopeptidase